MKKKYIAITSIAIAVVLNAFAALVDVDGNPATNETYIADIDQAEGTLGDLKEEIAPNYSIVANMATNAVDNTIAEIDSDIQMIDLMSTYGIASAQSNELQQMTFSGHLLTNKFVIAYDNGWKWSIYSADSENSIATGEIDDFSPMEYSTTIELVAPATSIYGTTNIVFQTGYSSKSASGITRDKDLTTIVYDDKTDKMTLYFKNGVSRTFLNSNQVATVATDIAQQLRPTKVSELANDTGFATTGQVATATSNLEYKIESDTNLVRRSDLNFSIAGSGNQLGMFSSAVGSNNTLANRSAVFGFNNRLLSPSYGNAQQYAFGFGNKSQAENNFIVGIGSGATSDGQNSITLGTMSVSTNSGSFVWNWYPTDYSSVEADQIFDIFPKYYSHGPGSFSINPVGGLKGFWIGETNMEQHIYNTIEEPVTEAARIVTANLMGFTTNQVDVMGKTVMSNVTASAYAGHGWPFGEWTYTPSTLALTTPVYTNNLWRYTETNSLGEVVGTARWVESPDGESAVQLNDTLNGTNVVFTRTSEEIYTNKLGFATTENLKQYVKHTQLEKTLNGFVTNEKLENYDASYKIVEGISDENQTIQLIVSTDANPEPLQIQLPSSGRAKDWIIYVLSEADMEIVLPPASYWIKSESVTNSIAGGTPTALYFSQVSSEGVYTIGRQEYITPITIQPPLSAKMGLMKSITSGKKRTK